ncbi:MAG: FGGY family carbohydrate kinase, partial [Candidatus Acidiferrum sp.]
MNASQKLLAFDLGADSGRGVLGRFDGKKLSLDVIHRFPNGPIRTLETIHWDVLRLHGEILKGVRKCAAAYGGAESVGVDTWGVDFALLGRGGHLLGNPRHYRDPYTEGVMDQAFEAMPRKDLYGRTGLQFLRFNTLFQLLAMQRDRSPLLEQAETLLFMPDLFHYFLTGVKVNEYTDASTSQLLDPSTRGWAFAVLETFGIPTKLAGSLTPPGTLLG